MTAAKVMAVDLPVALPAHPEQGIDPAQFEAVLGASTSVVLGSLLAYFLGQNDHSRRASVEWPKIVQILSVDGLRTPRRWYP